MQNTNNTIFFNFSYFALRLFGKNLYSNHWTAISELVANGLDAQASCVKIYINMKNKKKSTIEIMDNGHGMDYNDIAEKYVLIGKDKRDDKNIDEEIKKQFMGRKGIGKLAALHLTDKYYLISKTSGGETAWCLDTTNVKESEVPHLDRINLKDVSIEAKEEWNKFKTGTIIKLTNVDLTNTGEKTIAAFKARLADYYLLDELKGKIEIAVVTADEKAVFEKVNKSIAFKNMYAFYNNTDKDFSNKLSKAVFVSSSIDSIQSTPRPIDIVNPNKFTVRGKKKFLKPNGEYTEEELEYEMKGWIGIHTSIKIGDAHLNDTEYQKNKAYRPNKLKLYVRKKLAVENFLDYVRNTQAFSNYIEGEISFDILDHNELADIATSNRQGFVEDDERVVLLIKILKPIIGYLIRSRIKLGNIVKEEEEKYNEEIKRKKEAQRQEEERKRKEAEYARYLAEKDKEKEQKAKQKAERKVTKLSHELIKVSSDLGTEKKRNYFLYDALSEDQINYSKRLHMIKINVGTIEQVMTKIIMKIQRKKFKIIDVWDSLKTISYCTDRIKAVLQYGAAAQFDTKEESTTGDLFQYIYEYVKKVLNNYTNIKIQIDVKDNVEYIRKFSMQNIAVILENIVSNSSKHNATLLTIKMYKTSSEYAIDFIDNGNGLDSNITDIDELFEFAKSYTSVGTGIGLYHVREIVKEMGGHVEIGTETKNGFMIKMRYEI